MPDETKDEDTPKPVKVEDISDPKPKSRTFKAPAGTEIATTVDDTGERVEVSFDGGTFTTSDEAVIEVLAGFASDPDHPVQEG